MEVVYHIWEETSHSGPEEGELREIGALLVAVAVET